MNQKHFKLTSNFKIGYNGIKLFQVELTVDCKFGKSGDLGGFLESEESLKSENSWIYEDAVCYKKGVIRGGEIWGGEILGGEIRGGVIRGGVIRGGVIRGGDIWGGDIWGGEIWGGVIWGGVILGGVILKSPLQFQGSGHFSIVCKPGFLKIGCNEFDFKYWSKNFKLIGEENNYTEQEISEYGMWIKIVLKFGNDCFKKDENGICLP